MAALVLLAGQVACSTASEPPLEQDPAARLNLAQSLFDDGDLEQAETLAEAGLAAAKDPGLVWRFRLLLSEVALWRWDGEKALARLEGDPPDDPWIKASALLHRARACLVLKRFEEAVAWLDQSEDLASRYDFPGLQSRIKLRRGYLRQEAGDLSAAESLFQAAYRKAVEAQDELRQVQALGSLGRVLMAGSQWDRAERQFKTALTTARRARDLKSAARIQTNLGWCYYQLGAYETALQTLTEAETLSADMGLPDREDCLGNIGSVHFSRRDFGKAIEFYQRALGLSTEVEWKFKWLSNIAAAHIETGNWTSAEKFNSRALELSDRLSDKASLLYARNNAALILLETGRYAEAEALFRKMIAEGVDFEDPIPLWDGHAGLASLFKKTDRPAQAEKHYREALASVERVRTALHADDWKISFKSRWIHIAQDYVDLLMQQGEVEKALEIAESNRAVVLAGSLGSRSPRSLRSAAYYRKMARSFGAVFLSYWVANAPRRSYGWLVNGNGVKSFPLPDGDTLEKLVEGYRNFLERYDPLQRESGSAAPLYEALLEPVEADVPPSAHVILVPDGPLHDLNFETLVVPGSEDRYWINDVTLAATPSLAVLELKKPRPRGGESLLLIGDPISVDDRYPKLAGAAEEMAAIQGLFAEGEVELLAGEAAAPNAYLSSQPGNFSMIHFAAHAVANSESPLDSAVILSPTEDGFKLYARDVASTPLAARVVALSACRGAGARAYAGAGLVGFGWAFLQAGAENVVAGLGDVDDRATAKLMEGFYSNLRGGMSPASALRAAKLSLMEAAGAYRKPRYWAPFQVFTGASPFASQSPND